MSEDEKPVEIEREAVKSVAEYLAIIFEGRGDYPSPDQIDDWARRVVTTVAALCPSRPK